MWGAIPLPDADGSLREIAYIYDTLKLDGIGLLTSYDDGKLLGHPNFAPVLEELNRRKAVIFVHPDCFVLRNARIDTRNRVAIDYPDRYGAHDYGPHLQRIAHLRFPNIRWIFSHGGGTILMLTPRLVGGGNFDAGREGGDDSQRIRARIAKAVLRYRQRLSQPHPYGGRAQGDSQGTSFVWIGYPVFYD